MRKRDIRMDYRGWKFWDKVPLIPKSQMCKQYFDKKFSEIDIDIDTDAIKETIENTIENVMDATLGQQMCRVHKHIEDAKEHLCCDICHAKKDIKQHIDNKFEEINFEEQFSNLNDQAQAIINKLNTL